MNDAKVAEPPRCFVALFDIIGFKALRQRSGTAGLMQKFERGVLPLIQHSAAGRHKSEERNGQQVSVPDFHEGSAHYRIFSDTVLFWTRDDSFDSFLTIVRSSAQLAAAGFGTGSPYRGAIGYGDLLSQSEILIGQGIEDAYVWEESQAWAGVSFTPACEDHCLKSGYFERRDNIYRQALKSPQDDFTKTNLLKELRRLVRYSVPLQKNPKDGPAEYSERECLVLDWTLNVFEDAAKKMPDSDSLHAMTIKKNTVAFEDWARASRNALTE